jgi:hypothetical protein
MTQAASVLADVCSRSLGRFMDHPEIVVRRVFGAALLLACEPTRRLSAARDVKLAPSVT